MFKKTDKKIFSKGGKSTFKKYGREYMKLIGKKGGRPRKVAVDNRLLPTKPSSDSIK